MSYSIPEEINAIEISEPGGAEVLRLVKRPVREPQAGEVLIKVVSAGLNGADLSQRKGTYAMPSGVTDIPGLEVAGTVVAVGAGVAQTVIGNEVCALISGGGYAQFATAPHEQCMRIPHGVELQDAGGLPETFCTVWTNLMDRGALSAGEVTLIQGGTRGIGSTAIQIATPIGATA